MKNLTHLLFLLLAVLAAGLAFSCSSDSAEDTDPQPKPDPQDQQCVTAGVTYANTIVSLMSANCNSCHNSSLATDGVVLDTYAGVRAQASTGKLMGVITHAAGFSAMPSGGAKLSDCNIAKIKKWVDDGAPNN
ncbi:cytochrome c [Nibribacter koreensis]|uniref:Cytochrome c domain-containing protein n=1 Tax=Nibribacter koreensis TaxID=1084519 RepID=A0ABP8FE46_9BACT